ncbi:MAG TPA: arginine deiminase-related protein [Caulobacteraceae bacterium]|nr:arginine deiminase-related protein [Caulobacteraceae bacterium]
MSATILMTDPARYEVAYAINPWMRPADWSASPAAHAHAARSAWSRLKAALEAAGARVVVMEGEAGLPDMVFPANAAVVLDGKALIARFRHPERAPEALPFARAFERLQKDGLIGDVARTEGVFQEGAGDAIWDRSRRLFWVGSGPRSSPASAQLIGEHFGAPTVSLALATERFYHLDTCFCPLAGGEVLYYPPALTKAARGRFFDLVPASERIEASDEDADAFSVNAVSLGRTIIMARPPRRLADQLAERGYEVVGLDLSPFILSGGGAFCMTLRLDHTSGAEARAVRAHALETA